MEGDQQAESEASGLMAIEVETKDCTMLGDAELEAMADLCAEGPSPFGIGRISHVGSRLLMLRTAFRDME